MEHTSLTGILFLFACVDGLYRGLGDKYVVRMDELVSPLDRHILHTDKASLLASALVRRRVRRPHQKSRVKRSPDGGRNRFPEQFPSVESESYFQPECRYQNNIIYDPPSHSLYIRNGTCAPKGAFPWVVQIQVRNKTSGKFQHVCGGSLISDTHILTAAHCFMFVKPRDLRVFVGRQFNRDGVPGNGEQHRIKHFWKYDHFMTEGPYSHDIALVKLVGRVVPSSTVSPICLHSEKTLQQGEEGVVSGWGKTLALSSQLSHCLRAVKLPLWEQPACEEAFKYSSQRILPEMLCAGFPGVDSCDGDSGGPLAGFIDGNYRLVGIISWGFGCGGSEIPGVNTRVQPYLPWIREKMKLLH